MSSMRNAVQRRSFRERGQPEERQKWGLLEKHKDYSARARDFNKKKANLKALREKVLEKNPDEFYFGMMSKQGPATSGKKSTGTVNGDRGNQVLSQEASRLYKTQDLGYIRTMRNIALKEVEDLERRAKGISGEGRKVVFVENEKEQTQKVHQEDGNSGEGMDGDVDEEQDTASPATKKKERIKKQKDTEKLEARLGMARERLKALMDAEEALDFQRAKMAKSPSAGGINKHGVKYKVRERKR